MPEDLVFPGPQIAGGFDHMSVKSKQTTMHGNGHEGHALGDMGHEQGPEPQRLG